MINCLDHLKTIARRDLLNKFSSLVLFLVSTDMVWAQQNFFNIPSGDITPSGKVFYQHQFNVYSKTQMESKSHVVVGLGRDWDAGLNIVDLPLNFDGTSGILGMNDDASVPPLYPLAMLTLQKQFKLTDASNFNVGSQAGTNLTGNRDNIHFAHFTYSLFEFHPKGRGHWTAGGYLSNSVYTGSEAAVIGWMAGFDYPLSTHFSLMADIISGNHKKSLTTFGGIYNASKRLQICMAGLFPFPNRSLQGGIVVELNLYGWNWNEGE